MDENTQDQTTGSNEPTPAMADTAQPQVAGKAAETKDLPKSNGTSVTTKSMASNKTGLMVLVGIVAIAVISIILLIVWALSGSFNSDQAGVINYYANDPAKLQAKLNEEASSGFAKLAELDVETLASDPLAVYANFAPEMDVTYDYDANVEIGGAAMAASGLTSSTVKFSGQTGYRDKATVLDGTFDVSLGGSGINFGVNGAYKIVDNVLYFSAPDIGALVGQELPSKWISISLDEVQAELDSQSQNISDEELQETKETLEKLKNYDGEIFANAKSVESRTINDVELPCAELEISQDYVSFVQDMVATSAGSSAATADVDFEYTPYTICADGSSKPVYLELGAKAGEGSQEIDIKFSLIMELQKEVVEIVAPDASEVTTYTELTGGGIATKFNDAADARKREDVNAIANGISLYIVDNAGTLPTLNDASAIPTTTTANLFAEDGGADASELSGTLTPTYLAAMPNSVDSEQYKVGVDASGVILVGAMLSDGSPFIIQQ